MTHTLRDIKKAAEGNAPTSIDDATPAGHFVVITTVLGLASVYLLEGGLDEDDAIIKGRVEFHPSLEDETQLKPVAYRGDRLKGGSFFGYTNFEETFAKMV